MQETMDAGMVDFEGLVNALAKHDYQGAVSIEYFSGFDPEFKSALALREKLLRLGVSD